MPTETPRCVLCGKTEPGELLPIGAAGPQLTRWIADKLGHPVDRDDQVCHACMNRERITRSVSRLEKERGELTAIETQIAEHAASHLARAAALSLDGRAGTASVPGAMQLTKVTWAYSSSSHGRRSRHVSEHR